MEENLILLVEDCAEDASLVQAAFKKWGINNPVRVVPDGEQAVDYLSGKAGFADRSQHPLPCLAILDLNLPTLSGFEVLQWIRGGNSGPRKTSPVVVAERHQKSERF